MTKETNPISYLRKDKNRYILTTPQFGFFQELKPKMTLSELFQLLLSLEFVRHFPHLMLRVFKGEELAKTEPIETARFVPVIVYPDEDTYVFNVPNVDRRLTPTDLMARIMINLHKDVNLGSLCKVVLGTGLYLDSQAHGIELKLPVPTSEHTST